MRLNKVRYKNLLAVGNSPVEIDLVQAKKTLVMGPNGSGKTGGLIEPLAFGLYNRSFRKVNRAKLINSITNKGLLVEVEFETPQSSFLVRRGLKPNVFEIYRNGVLVDPPADARDHQEWLETQVLKMNFRTFCQCVILGSRNYVPFMQLPAAERRAIVENLLDIEVFSVMNLLLRNKMETSRGEIEKSDRALSEVQAQIDLNNKRLAATKKDVATIIAEKENLIEEMDQLFGCLKRDAENEQSKIEVYKKAMVPVDEDNLTRMAHQHADLMRTETQITKDLDFFQAHLECPTCNQEITGDFRFNKVRELKEALEKNTRSLAVLADGLKELREQKAANFINEKNMDACKQLLQHMIIKGKENRWYATDLLREILKLKIPKKEDDITEGLTERLDAVLGERDSILKAARTLAKATNLLKDGGVKAKVVRRFIPWLNQTVNKYLEALDLFVIFEMNEQFEEKIYSRGRDDFTYENLSEGEKLRLDLALLFAWRDLGRARASAVPSLLVLDEILDSSMDGEGVEEFLKVMDRLSDAENVIVISHRGEAVIDRFDRVLRFRKSHNFSVLEEEAA